MRKVVVSEFLTMDGVMEDPAWSAPYYSDEQEKYKLAELLASDALLLGRVTYEGFASAWPAMTDEQGFADRMNGLPKHVATRTLKTFTWNNSRALEGDIAEAVSSLKNEPGQDILVGGSAQLVQTLTQNDLVDEYRLMVFPVTVGKGKRLFSEQAAPKTFELAGVTPFASGVVVQSYRPKRSS
jgi:dihydrofolate reductase